MAIVEGRVETGARADTLEVRWRLRLGIVFAAFVAGMVLDLLADKFFPDLTEIGPILRFVTLDLVSMFVSLWPTWLLFTFAVTILWWALTLASIELKDTRQFGVLKRIVASESAFRSFLATPIAPALVQLARAFFARSSSTRVLRQTLGLASRNMGHLEAAFVCVVIAAALWPSRLMVTLPLLAAIFALGLPVTGKIGEAYLKRRRQTEGPPSGGELLAARRWVVGLATLGGVAFLMGYARPQALVLVWLALTYAFSVALRLLALQSIRKRSEPEALKTASAATVHWAKRGDILFTGLLLAVILGGRACVYQANSKAEAADREARVHPGASVASEPTSESPRRASLFILSDSQFHEVTGRRVGVHRNLVDSVISVAVRPVELDLLSGVTYRHFHDVYEHLRRERPAMLWAHLGDFGDLGCPRELERSEKYARLFDGRDPTRLAALVPGNHDSTFVGNFVWHPDWDAACRPAGDRTPAAFLVDKAMANQKLFELMLPRLPLGSVHTLVHSWDGPSATALVTFRVLDETGDKVVGAFLDTSDYTIEDAPESFGLAGEQGNVSRDQADLVRRALREDHPKAKVILFMHHPFAALSRPAQGQLRAIFSDLGARLLAVVSAHTHVAGLRYLDVGGRRVPELVVGSILDPPQEATLLDVLADGTLRFTTIPAVDRAGSPAITYRDRLTASQCEQVIEALPARCDALRKSSGTTVMTLDADRLKQHQQVRAAQLLACLEVDLGDELVQNDGSCPTADRASRACPLDAPSLYTKLDALFMDPSWNDERRRRLVCLASAAALLQRHKAEGWDYAKALHAIASTDTKVDYHPLVVEYDPGTGKVIRRDL